MPRLSAFLGDWRLRRRIADLREGETGRLVGEVRFGRGESGLVERQEGTLRLPGRPPLSAMRTYLWSEPAGRLVVRFADGRPFHELAADEAAPEAEHRCGADLYRVRYDFRRWPRWRTVWHVRGPRKDLVIVSALAPLAPDGTSGQNRADHAASGVTR
jgi:hypothetical protein